MKKASETKVEVDMVPLIDIVSLLLMFLIMVGDMSKSASAVKMKLPRASEGKTDKELGEQNLEGRIVVQLREISEGAKKYEVVIENKAYSLQGGRSGSLMAYFDEQIKKRQAKGEIKLDEKTGAAPIPIKMRVPANAPMSQVQQLVTNIAGAKLVNVQYAVDNKK